MCEPRTPVALLEAVRGLHVADPDLGVKPLLAKLREQQLDLGAGTREVREALMALKVESEAKVTIAQHAAAAVPLATAGSGAPPNVALSLACFGCARLPSDMDDGREKHEVCPICVKLKVPTTYWCCVECPGNPGAWKLHAVYHKELKHQQRHMDDGGLTQQRARELAEKQARIAEQNGDKYSKLLAEGARYNSKEDWRKAGKAYREAITLNPDEPYAYFNLGVALDNSGHDVEAAQRYLEAKERYQVGTDRWARAAAAAFGLLRLPQCGEAAKPEWWNDEELKALSARVVRALPNEVLAHTMRARVLSLQSNAWKPGPRSAAEVREAAAHFERAAALSNAPVAKAGFAGLAEMCRGIPSKAAAMSTARSASARV